MKRFFDVLKVLVLTVTIVFLSVLAVSCEKQETDPEYELKLSELNYKKQLLVNERDRLESDVLATLGNTSYMSLLFTGLDSVIYTDIFGVMTDGDIKIVGVLAFSRDELPGMEGKITEEQYRLLVSQGWGNALYWDGEGELSAFLDDMKASLESIGIDMPKSIAFKAKTYLKSYDALLGEYGIVNAVHSGEEGLDIIEVNEPDGVWHPGRVGWIASNSGTLKQYVETNSGYALFEIGFDTSVPQTSYYTSSGGTNVSRLEKMLGIFRDSIAAGKVEVLDIDGTREKVLQYNLILRDKEAYIEARTAELDAEIQKIERKITDLYYEYH